MNAQYAEFIKLTQSGDFIDLPHRLEPFGENGYTVARMSPEVAARFWTTRKDCAMPCWARFEVRDGRLVQTN